MCARTEVKELVSSLTYFQHLPYVNVSVHGDTEERIQSNK